MSTEALASLYTTPLQGDQIRLLRLLPTRTCPDCGQFHLGEDENDEDEAKCDTSNPSSSSASSSLRVHDACKGHGCIDCDRMACELITMSLDEIAGKFESLSYVWGVPFDREAINVNGMTVPVTMNLEAALRRARNKEKAELLWVDAICINQTDFEEKSVQVMRMKEIYEKSKRVLVWIGDTLQDEDEEDGEEYVRDANTAILLLKNIHRMAQGKQLSAKPDPYQMFVADMPPFEDPSKLGLPDVESPDWKSLNRFLSRPWFGRVWIIQEIASAREAVVLVGNDIRIGWKQMAVAIIWLLCHGYPDNIPGLHNCWNVVTIDVCRKESAVPLLRRMSPTSTFHSTLPHDKIFALLGMTTEGQKLEEYPRLRIDYTRDWRELFRDVVRHCIETPGSFGKIATLHVLSQVRHQSPDAPFTWDMQQSSWVPDFDDDNQHCPIAWRGYCFDMKTTKGTEASIIESGDSRILSLKGIVVDKVSKVWLDLVDVDDNDDPFFSINVFSAIADIWSSLAFNWKLNSNNRYAKLGDAFATLLTTGYVGRNDTDKASPGMFFAAYWQMAVAIVEEEDHKFKNSYLVGPLQKKDVSVWDHTHEDDADERMTYIANMAALFKTAVELDKAVFVTETGYLGIGPAITRAGDEVCVLYGGVTPYVVQRVKRGVNCPEWLEVESTDSQKPMEKLKSSMKSLLPFGRKSTKSSAASKKPIESDDGKVLPKTDLYRFVGECYVEGLMDGEAMDLQDSGKLQEKIVHLV